MQGRGAGEGGGAEFGRRLSAAQSTGNEGRWKVRFLGAQATAPLSQRL